MFERPEPGKRALLVHVELSTAYDPEELSEFKELARSAGAVSLALVVVKRRWPDAGYFIGRGKVAEIEQTLIREQADLVIINHALSPSQQRNLERAFNCRVVDRTGLILDIFAQRAHSFEGKLQVELAQLQHLSTRLIRGWTHLERQKGGIGLRGPGETQLESDRRLINQRIKQIKKRLVKVDSQRAQGRRGRAKADIPTVSLVGYTNAGKSTLFNALSDSDVYAADQLFATLDPTLRKIELNNEGAAVIADTVGFIRHLPHDLVAAFKSTLQETSQAALLLHVVDASSSRRDMCISEVEEVLGQIGAEDIYQIQIFNKIDLLDGVEPRIELNDQGLPARVWLSAVSGRGLDLLLQALSDYFSHSHICQWFQLEAAAGRLHAALHRCGSVLCERNREQGGWEMQVDLSEREYRRLLKDEPELAECLRSE